MGMGRSFYQRGAREQFLWGWGGHSTTGEWGSSYYKDGENRDGEIVPPLGREEAVLMEMGRSFHHWGAREQFLWGWGGWGDFSTTGERGSSSYGDREIVPPLGSEEAVLMEMGRSFHHWRVREQVLWGWGRMGWGDRSTTGERGSSSYGDGEDGDGEVVPSLGSGGAVLMGMGRMGMGRSFHHWGAREQFLWGWGGWGDFSTTGERGSSSYGDTEIVPPLGSEEAVLMEMGKKGMGRSFHHWGAGKQLFWGWG